MGTLLQSESRRLYSWWWDSHISPKNSKWLQENLTDMDAKVKAMIKLIEEDADSFARRAEMYYKKRPELMKLVEEFYRAYRALAERYDNATGALRQAQRTMAEVFPNQVPFSPTDDSPSSSFASEGGPQTPDMRHPIRAMFDPDDLHKDALGLSSSQFQAAIKNLALSDEKDLLTRKKGLKQVNEMFGSEVGTPDSAKFSEGKAKKGLNFHDEDGKSSDHKTHAGSRDFLNRVVRDGPSELSTEKARAGQAEIKIQSLTEALEKLEAETEASLLQYQQSLERLSYLEAEVSRAQEESRRHNERAVKSETEAESLKQSLARLEDEKEAGFVQYKQCLERISDLENRISLADEDAGRLHERASKAETEVQTLKQDLAKQEVEKETSLLQYQQSLERISNLEMKVTCAEEDAKGLNVRADKAETEARSLNEALTRLESEREACLIQYEQSLQTIDNLKSRISQAEEDAKGLNDRASKAEANVQTLQEALVRLQSEKEAGLVQYKQCLETISNLESEISRAEEGANGLHDRASKAETEVQTLQETLTTLVSEKKAGLVQYKQCLEMISDLESKVSRAKEEANGLNDRASKAETELETVREVLAKLQSENKTSLLQYKQCLETISDLESKISRAEENANGLHDRASKAETELETVREVLAKLQSEMGSILLQYKQCLEKISDLESKVSRAEENANGLNDRASKAETELETVREVFARLQSEKESILLQYKQCLEKISDLESKVSGAEENANGLHDRTSKAETEVETLQEVLARLQSEKESSLLHYKQSMETIADLEAKISRTEQEAEGLNDRAIKAETNVQILQEALTRYASEKEASLVQYKQCLETISNLESKVSRAEEDAYGLNDRASKAELEVETLREVLARLESEKEAGLHQYQQCLVKISNLEMEVSRAEEVAEGLNVRADKAETEARALKEALTRSESEREAGLVEYKQCLETITDLKNRISEAEKEAQGLHDRASKAENNAQTLQEDLARLQAEREASLVQYNQCLGTISNLETEISHTEEEARKLAERAEEAENKVQSLQQYINSLHEEKENAALQYQTCLEIISNLETELFRAQEEVRNLNDEIEKGIANLNSSEEQNLSLERENQSLQTELDSLQQKTEIQRQELVEKHEELEKLWCRIQEETLRSMQAEASLDNLKDLHSHSIEEQKALAVELQEGGLMLKDVELRNHNLESELQQVKEENGKLNEQISSSALSMKNMQEEIFRTREMIEKLEEEVELRLDQRNALQQEINCLKEEIKDANGRYQGVIEQVVSVGLIPECVGSSVKDLQLENSKLKETCQNENDEKLALLRKLATMEELLEKNALLENSLSDVSAELEGLRMKIKALESSCLSLQEEKCSLLAEKSTLVSQLELVTEKIEKLSEKNEFLEKSVFDANDELEGLREKSNSLEESYRVLDVEKSVLLTERASLLSSLEGIQERLEVLEKKYAELEEKYSNLVKEKTSTTHQVQELRAMLDVEKQEHSNFVQASEMRLASLEEQIFHVQEEGRWRKKEFEEEQDKAMKTQVEIFILQRSIQDMEEKNFILMIECQKYFEASKVSEDMISELEKECLEQHVESNSLLNQLENLRMGLHQILNSPKIEPDHEIKEDEILLQYVQGKIEDMESALLTSQDENQQMLFEKLVFVTLLERLKLEAADIESMKNTLDQELKVRSKELMLVQSEKQELLEMNGQLTVEVREGEQREEQLKGEIGNIRGTLSDLREKHHVLQYENSKGHEENKLLMKECSELKEEKHVLEEENIFMLEEITSLGNLYLISQSYCIEKAVEIEGVSKDLDHLCGVKNELEKEVSIIKEKLETVEMENFHLKGSIVKFEDELNTVRNMNTQLDHLLEEEKNMLSQKEIDLSETEQKLEGAQSENEELLRDIKNLNVENSEARVIQEELEKQYFNQLEVNTHQNEEIRFLRESQKKSELELVKLISELENEVKLRDEESAKFYADLQMFTILSHVFEEKVNEVIGTCKSLEDENSSKQAEIDRLKQRLDGLECESKDLKSKLAAYLPIIDSLRNNITSLEDRTLSHTKIDGGDNQDGEFVGHLGNKSFKESIEEQGQSVVDGVSDLQELQAKVISVEKALMEMEKLREQERLDASTRLETAIKEIKELKSKNSNVQGEKARRSNVTIAMQLEKEEVGTGPENLKVQKTDPEISEVGDGISMKDIPLDQISECSSYDHGFGSHGISRKETAEADDQMLELWETIDHDLNFDSKINKSQRKKRSYTREHSTYHQSENPESEFETEKELGVDKLQLSRRTRDSNQESNKQKILERLASDTQKLTNLQITIQDLRKRVEKSKKVKKTKFIEYNNIKEQLQLVEESHMQLVDLNGKLSQNAEESPLPSDRRSLQEFEEREKLQRRRVLEQAREESEKIGKLQLEVQKVQFLLLKLEDENRIKGIKIAKKSTGSFIHDYIYSGVRGSNQGRKKTPCCACIRKPSTVEE